MSADGNWSFLLADFEDLVSDILVEEPRPPPPPPSSPPPGDWIDPEALAAELEATFEGISAETITDLDLWSTMRLLPTRNVQRVPIVLPPVRAFLREPVRVHEDESASTTIVPEETTWELTEVQRRRLFGMR